VRAIVTAPEGVPLVVVRVDTSEPGLYGLGCATFTQRYAAVAAESWDVQYYLAHTPELFAAARERLGAEVSLMHDVHSRLTPKQARWASRSDRSRTRCG
jgi:L-alanine-DL-glutamate epimerase-like enolase superfamily enzyme